jgi:FSR family fosmidomycin resistance protein-like MFS transporter
LRFRTLVCLAAIHTLVDSFSTYVVPLWPTLETKMGMAPWLFAVTYGAWQVAASMTQPLFGYWGDRFGGRWMVGLGPALAIVSVSLVGFAAGPISLIGLLVVGGLGIGAFHPEAAVSVADVAGAKATRGLALFTFGGMLGLGIGPLLSGSLSDRFGLTGLSWTLVPGLLLLMAFLVGSKSAIHHSSASDQPVGLGEILRGRGWLAALLLLVATLRVIPALGIPLVQAYLLKEQGISNSGIGRIQSLFLLSGSLGTLVCPLFVRPGKEVGSLVRTSLAAAGFLLLLTWRHPIAYYAGLIGSGWFLQGAIPTLIGYSQHMLPKGRRLGASLTLGTSWGLGGFVVAGMKSYFGATENLDGMMWALVPFAFAAAGMCCLLPRLAPLTWTESTPGIAACPAPEYIAAHALE